MWILILWTCHYNHPTWPITRCNVPVEAHVTIGRTLLTKSACERAIAEVREASKKMISGICVSTL